MIIRLASLQRRHRRRRSRARLFSPVRSNGPVSNLFYFGDRDQGLLDRPLAIPPRFDKGFIGAACPRVKPLSAAVMRNCVRRMPVDGRRRSPLRLAYAIDSVAGDLRPVLHLLVAWRPDGKPARSHGFPQGNIEPQMARLGYVITETKGISAFPGKEPLQGRRTVVSPIKSCGPTCVSLLCASSQIAPPSARQRRQNA